jgi:hypothetical protein
VRNANLWPALRGLGVEVRLLGFDGPVVARELVALWAGCLGGG